MKLEHTIAHDEAGQRLDLFLTARIEEMSRAKLQSLIAAGDVTVNGEARKPSFRLRVGDTVTVNYDEEPPETVEAQPIPLKVHYEDDDIIVVEKPAGMITHPAGYVVSDTLVNALLHLGPLAPTGAPLRPGIVHRLDKGTSGVMVAARSDSAYHGLVRQFAERTVAKTYVAIARGRVPLDEGEIMASIGRSAGDKTRFAVSPIDAKEAHTTYRAIRRFGDATLLHIRIHTGRTHQIRVHLEYLGYPIIGDAVYGRESNLIGRPALHALSLGFTHPRTDERMRFVARLPEDMVELTVKLTERQGENL
ncbi:MAG: RluA family pseudouridine synthase [bacterium]|nr:RluA family pseudouridine synthase [bacterium]